MGFASIHCIYLIWLQNNEFKGLEFLRSEDVLVTMPGLGSIGCHVDSNPLPHDFRWGFRSSKKEENSRTTTNPTGKPKPTMIIFVL